MFAINVQVTAVTGVAVRFDIKLLTALSAGTAITSQPCDSTNPPLDAGVLCRTGGTTTEGNILFPFVTNNDESGATNAFPTNVIQQFGNLIPEGLETQELVLRSAQGMTVRQITGTTVGSFAWLAVITQE